MLTDASTEWLVASTLHSNLGGTGTPHLCSCIFVRKNAATATVQTNNARTCGAKTPSV